MKTVRKHSKILIIQETDHGQTGLNNMLAKKSSLNEKNIEGTYTHGFKD